MNVKLKKWLKYVVHNCIVHPSLPFLPKDFGEAMHELNAKWAFSLKETPSESVQPVHKIVKTSKEDNLSFLEQLKRGDHCENKETWKQAVELSQKYPITPPSSFSEETRLEIKCASNS